VNLFLGEANAYQHMISRDESGNIAPPSQGGSFGPEKDITSIKYPGEGRGCFCVAVVTRDGVKEGVRLLQTRTSVLRLCFSVASVLCHLYVVVLRQTYVEVI
jgi:hypothetical protein